jgi:L-threonylcarbamoyladenylate synthase
MICVVTVTDTDLDRAAAVLRAGELVAFPTETVYGLGGDAASVGAIGRIYEVKGRPADHPLIVHLPLGAELDRWAADVPSPIEALVAAFWPGPLTVVVPRAAGVQAAVSGGLDTVALRVPAHPVALALLERFGSGIAAPSANRFGRVSPTTADHVRADLGSDVATVLDGGPCAVGLESTIVSPGDDGVEILRPGALGVAELEAILGPGTVRHRRPGGPTVASGMLASHYSPEARVAVVDDHSELGAALAATPAGISVAVLAPTAIDPAVLGRGGGDVVELEPAGDAEGFAHVLYDRLRQADRLGVDRLVIVAPPDRGIGVAVRDRLARAAAG